MDVFLKQRSTSEKNVKGEKNEKFHNRMRELAALIATVILVVCFSVLLSFSCTVFHFNTGSNFLNYRD